MEWVLMPLRRYAEFSGRSRRMEFWIWHLFQFAVYIAISMLTALLGEGAGDADLSSPAMILNIAYLLFWLATLVPTVAVTVRRLHDSDRGGAWWFIAPFPPFPTAAILVAALGIGLAVAGAAGSAWMIPAILLAILCLVGWVVLLVFLFSDGTRGPNRFGDDPKGAGVAQVFA